MVYLGSFSEVCFCIGQWVVRANSGWGLWVWVCGGLFYLKFCFHVAVFFVGCKMLR